jgi:8-oxo-dGTP diphosphatase
LSKKRVHVAVAVIVQQQQLLIALRKPEQHLGGLWEFPGGKVEPNETVLNALVREIEEEIGIHIEGSQEFLKFKHDYPDKAVLLDVHWVDNFTGQPVGREGQQIKWCHVADLERHSFPDGSLPIIAELKQRLLN